VKPDIKGYMICETGGFESSAQIIKNSDSYDKRVIIKTTLQESDIKNRNKRIYPKNVITNGLSTEYIQERIKTKTFYGK